MDLGQALLTLEPNGLPGLNGCDARVARRSAVVKLVAADCLVRDVRHLPAAIGSRQLSRAYNMLGKTLRTGPLE